MPDVAIRAVEGQEMLDIFHYLDSYAFRATPPLPVRPAWDAGFAACAGATFYAVFENGNAVAIAMCTRLTQTVRGAQFGMVGYGSIATHPIARRKGYVRQLFRHGHTQHREEGRVLTCLYPVRESFYERLGYVTFPNPLVAVFKPDHLVPLLQRDIGGEFELSLVGDTYADYLGFVRDLQMRIHGMAMFETPQEEAARQNPAWVVYAKVDGRVEGIMTYSIQGNQMTNHTLQADHFYYRTSQAKYLLLQWLARHFDQVGTVRMALSPSEHPNTWYADLRPKLEPETDHGAPMGRVLDVAGIGGLEVGPGSLTFAISDPACPWNNGVWRFAESDGKLCVSPGLIADCSLSVQGLSALVYGVSDPAEFAIRGWGDPSAETAEIMRQMFPARVPFVHEHF